MSFQTFRPILLSFCTSDIQRAWLPKIFTFIAFIYHFDMKATINDTGNLKQLEISIEFDNGQKQPAQWPEWMLQT